MENACAPIWCNLTPEAHEFHYNPQHAFPDFGRMRVKRAPMNEATKQELECHADIAYGDHPLRKLDIYPAAGTSGKAPVHIFIHGGYWRAQDKANFAFVAGALVPLGITTVVMNYELCPASTLDGVVDSAISAFDWVSRTIGEYGGDPMRMTLSGHSAGAHLGAEIMAHPWPSPEATGLAGVVLTSGIYDPAPAALTSVNAQLNLDEDLSLRRNVEVRQPVVAPKVAILVGGREPWHWVDQSFRYYKHLRRHDIEPALHVLPAWGHFDILDEYLDVSSVTIRTILSHCGIERND